jgi:ABC-type polysaccharide/polyol phosphate export permease
MKKNEMIQLAVFDSAKDRGLSDFLSRSVRELIMYRYALYNLINTNLRARYRRSTIGFLWTLLNPLFTMIIIAVVFSTLFKLPFADFGVYLFSGILTWTLISNSIINGSMSMINAEGYLKKVYVPKLIFPLATVGVETANFLFSLISLFVLALFLGAKASWGLLFLPFALLMTALFVFGLIAIVSILTVYFRDLAHILTIVFLGLFYLTPIMYKKELITNENLMTVIKMNPFYYFVELFHQIIYEAKIPDGSLWLTCGVLMLVSLIVGLYVFSLKEKDIVYRL